jgi:hypothetical protein
VTGSGLPAEIFGEAMKRVHAGLPARALPVLEPERPRRVADETPRRQRRVPQAQAKPQNELERALIGVLNDIFGN